MVRALCPLGQSRLAVPPFFGRSRVCGQIQRRRNRFLLRKWLMGHPSPCLGNLWPLWSLHQPSLQDLRDQMYASSLPKAHYPEVGCSSLHSSPDLLKGAELVSTRRVGIAKPRSPLFEGPNCVFAQDSEVFPGGY
jgi:hypothetical protein